MSDKDIGGNSTKHGSTTGRVLSEASANAGGRTACADIMVSHTPPRSNHKFDADLTYTENGLFPSQPDPADAISAWNDINLIPGLSQPRYALLSGDTIPSQPTSGTDPTAAAAELVKARIIIQNIENDFSSFATTLIILLIKVMTGFQKSKVLEAINELNSVVTKISVRIKAMESERNNTLVRDSLQTIGEAASACASALSAFRGLKKIGVLYQQSSEVQDQLSRRNVVDLLETKERLKTEVPALEKKLGNIKTSNSTAQNETRIKIEEELASLKKAQAKNTNSLAGFDKNSLDEMSADKNNLPSKEILEATLSSLRLEIARQELTSQLLNSASPLFKTLLATCAAAPSNLIQQNKIEESSAEMSKSVAETQLRLALEVLSALRDALNKLFSSLEQAVTIQVNHAKAAIRFVA